MKFYQVEENKNLKNQAAGILVNPRRHSNIQIMETSARWNWRDYLGQILVRTTSYRNTYNVKPGVYRLGNPDENSHVLVSANYKLSFDILRKNLEGRNVWILVLDTKGINVWCAAGKGTFGTNELVQRMEKVNLASLVRHKQIILPQLGGPGVSAPQVKKLSGFRVIYGPVYAKDIPQFLDADLKTSPKMRRIRFSFAERLVLTPMELIPAFRYYLYYALAVFLFFGFHSSGILFRNAIEGGFAYLVAGFAAILSGALFTPALLPLIPSRAFAIKGWVTGLLTALAITTQFGWNDNAILLAFVYLFVPMMSSFLALQFTGSTVYTNMSGVKKELKYALPVYMVSAALSGVLVVLGKFKIAGWF